MSFDRQAARCRPSKRSRPPSAMRTFRPFAAGASSLVLLTRHPEDGRMPDILCQCKMWRVRRWKRTFAADETGSSGMWKELADPYRFGR